MNDRSVDLSESKLRLTWHRASRTVGALRGLCTGSFKHVMETAEVKGESDWGNATPLQRQIVQSIWEKQLERAHWGSIDDGGAVLRRLGEKPQVGDQASRPLQ